MPPPPSPSGRNRSPPCKRAELRRSPVVQQTLLLRRQHTIGLIPSATGLTLGPYGPEHFVCSDCTDGFAVGGRADFGGFAHSSLQRQRPRRLGGEPGRTSPRRGEAL